MGNFGKRKEVLARKMLSQESQKKDQIYILQNHQEVSQEVSCMATRCLKRD